MFYAVIVCAVAVSCGLSGQFRSNRPHVDKQICLEQTMAALQMLGENPSHFHVTCIKGAH